MSSEVRVAREWDDSNKFDERADVFEPILYRSSGKTPSALGIQFHHCTELFRVLVANPVGYTHYVSFTVTCFVNPSLEESYLHPEQLGTTALDVEHRNLWTCPPPVSSKLSRRCRSPLGSWGHFLCYVREICRTSESLEQDVCQIWISSIQRTVDLDRRTFESPQSNHPKELLRPLINAVLVDQGCCRESITHRPKE
jgi:hypothetical protein